MKNQVIQQDQEDQNEEEDSSGLWGCTTCPHCGSCDYEVDETGDCSICGNTVDNT